MPAPSIARARWLLAGASLLACGDSGRPGDSSEGSPAQISSVSEPGTSDTSTTATTDGATTSTSGQVPTEAGSGTVGSGTGESSGGTTTGTPGGTTGPGDPSASETAFDTGLDCAQTLQATVRDFRGEHPDFEAFTSETGLKGIVEATLGPDKKPVYASGGPTAQTSGPGNYAQW